MFTNVNYCLFLLSYVAFEGFVCKLNQTFNFDLMTCASPRYYPSLGIKCQELLGNMTAIFTEVLLSPYVPCPHVCAESRLTIRRAVGTAATGTVAWRPAPHPAPQGPAQEGAGLALVGWEESQECLATP